MQQTITPPNTIAPALNTGSDDALIGVGVIFPSFTPLSNFILHMALSAGLQRAAIATTEAPSSYFRPGFCVCLFTVRASQKNDAFRSLKKTLTELELARVSVLASRTPEQIWLNVDGMGFAKGKVNFAEVFLKDEDMATAIKEKPIEMAMVLDGFAKAKAILEQLGKDHPDEK